MTPFWFLAIALLGAWFVTSGKAAAVMGVILSAPGAPPPAGWGPGGSSSGSWGP